ncbi:DUF7333 family protein [Natranaeroarchaeum sulfidigenes]|uniref:Putative membrane protein n=1 Tax=Natranaeroarchaeum sulfidigenes TaxID=2784880 RepID=A0A897MXJ7_9EURY|nr:hypothetical protein [Natranaeroarchaeum sulfidigenes]QSG03639.1 putative membrane protein [Natranaeroarchaeum sulfidigenes]
MEFDLTKTVVAFLAVNAIGVGALMGAPMGMTESTILTMVLPSMLVFGALTLAIGVKFGEYRAKAA